METLLFLGVPILKHIRVAEKLVYCHHLISSQDKDKSATGKFKKKIESFQTCCQYSLLERLCKSKYSLSASFLLKTMA